MAEQRDEFVNRTQGWVGAIKINRKGDEVAIAVEPGARVFLTADEQKLTADAHRSQKDSPFVEREIIHYDPATQEQIDRFVAPLLERVTSEPTPAEREPASRRRPATAVAT